MAPHHISQEQLNQHARDHYARQQLKTQYPYQRQEGIPPPYPYMTREEIVRSYITDYLAADEMLKALKS